MLTQPHDSTKRRPHLRRLVSTFGGFAAVSVGLVIGAPTAVADPTQEAVRAINQTYTDFGGAASLLGTPVGKRMDANGGARQDYTGGAIFYSEKSGAHVMYGQILEKYRAMGGQDSGIGFPLNNESDAGDGVGRFNDFSKPGGAAIYWRPTNGAWLLGGKVLDAWRASGAIRGPFGYPSADLAEVNGVSIATFAGPKGTQISWSDNAGLTTVPAALAATIPGFTGGTHGTVPTNAEGTLAVSTPQVTVSAPSTAPSTRGFKWWPWVIGLGLLALLGALLAAVARRRRPAEVAVASRAHDVRAPRAPAPPRLVDTRAPQVEVPRVAPPPPPKPRPVVPERPRPAGGNGSAGSPVRPRRPGVEPSQRVTTPPASKVAAAPPAARLVDRAAGTPQMAVHFEDDEAKGLGDIEITYENNAVGAHQESREDKSDLH